MKTARLITFAMFFLLALVPTTKLTDISHYGVVDDDGYFYEDGSFHPTWGNPTDVGYELGETLAFLTDGTRVQQDVVELKYCTAIAFTDYTLVAIDEDYHIYDDILPDDTLGVVIDTKTLDITGIYR